VGGCQTGGSKTTIQGGTPASSTACHYNYNITKYSQIITYANYRTGFDNVNGEAKLTTYDKTTDVTNYARFTTIDGLNGTWVATV
jgi:hypothetical protein